MNYICLFHLRKVHGSKHWITIYVYINYEPPLPYDIMSSGCTHTSILVNCFHFQKKRSRCCWNFVTYIPDYMTSHLRRPYLKIHSVWSSNLTVWLFVQVEMPPFNSSQAVRAIVDLGFQYCLSSLPTVSRHCLSVFIPIVFNSPSTFSLHLLHGLHFFLPL
jgi:hypothetical protein